MPDRFYSLAYGINNTGQVVGYAYTIGDGDPYHATLWNGTTPTDLGTLGGTRSEAYKINNSGDVIGMAYTATNATNHPFLYTGGIMYDFYDLLASGTGVTDLGVSDINDLGQISAFGTIGGQQHALLLTPTVVPEPSTALFGAIGIAALFRRRTRK